MHKIGQQPARRHTPVDSEPTVQQCLNHASANYEQPHKITPTDISYSLDQTPLSNSRRTRIVAALLPGVITTVTALLKVYPD